MTENEKDKVIDRIRKILALAGNNPNEAEAAAAAAKAQAMLAEYNLELADVTHVHDHESDMVLDNELQTDSRPWRRQLGTMIAKMYFCGYYYTFIKKLADKKCGYVRYDRHSFMGERHNVVVAKLMFQYLQDTIERLAREGAGAYPPNERGSFMNSFRHACANRLCWRIHERIEAAKRGEIKTESGTTLPALLNLYEQAGKALEKFKEDNDLRVRSTKSRGQSNHTGGVIAGDLAGRTISLDQQVPGKDKTRQIKAS